jgi:hypothetical protein
VHSFVADFGRRVYRRPLAPEEIDAHVTLYAQARLVAEPADAVAAVLRAMFQSPLFLYRPELAGTPAGTGRLALSGYEVATRLSYFFWGTMPDPALLAAAEAGKLSTPDEIAAQARRLLADPRAREGVGDFFRQWLGIDDVSSVTKDAAVYPDWSPSLAASMRQEGRRFVQRTIFEGDAKLASLFTSRQSVLDGALGRFYGVDVPAGADWQVVNVQAAHRIGLLTQGWFLATRASQDASNPTFRGLFIQERLFCNRVPPPPPNIPPLPPALPGSTTRERYAMHRTNPACAACHTLIDSPGFPFEAYDGTGAYRTMENGKPIDTSGELIGTDVDGRVADAVELSGRVAASSNVRACLVRRWFEQTAGRASATEDACALAELERAFQNSDGNLRELMVSLATAPGFRTRPAAGVAGAPGTMPLITDPTVSRTVQKMILDLVSLHLTQLRQRHADPRDRLRLDQHLQGVRELEISLPP